MGWAGLSRAQQRERERAKSRSSSIKVAATGITSENSTDASTFHAFTYPSASIPFFSLSLEFLLQICQCVRFFSSSCLSLLNKYLLSNLPPITEYNRLSPTIIRDMRESIFKYLIKILTLRLARRSATQRPNVGVKSCPTSALADLPHVNENKSPYLVPIHRTDSRKSRVLVLRNEQITIVSLWFRE